MARASPASANGRASTIGSSSPCRSPPGAGPSDLHLVSLPINRVDLVRTQRYADSVRAATYASNRGEADFAVLSGEVARTLNQIAGIADPKARLAMAERARRALADWPGTHYGYRSAEVREFVGVLDEVISGLRASAGGNRFDLALSATTTEVPETEALIPAPDQTEVIRGLMSAAQAVDSPAEKVSLLQSVVALVDRAVDLLPDAFAKTIRASAVGSIADEQRIERNYARLRTTVLTEAAQHASRANVRGLERLRTRVHEQDKQLGERRPDDVAALMATIDSHLDSAHRLRLAQDQWPLRIERSVPINASAGPLRRHAGASEPRARRHPLARRSAAAASFGRWRSASLAAPAVWRWWTPPAELSRRSRPVPERLQPRRQRRAAPARCRRGRGYGASETGRRRRVGRDDAARTRARADLGAGTAASVVPRFRSSAVPRSTAAS